MTKVQDTSKTLFIRTSQVRHAKIVKAAKEQNITIQEYINNLVDNALQISEQQEQSHAKNTISNSNDGGFTEVRETSSNDSSIP